MNKTANAIMEVLNGAATKLAKAGKWTDKKWTKGVKDALVELGNQEDDKNRCEGGYVTCAASCENADCGEWLYDVCWLNYKDNNLKSVVNPLLNVALVAESEWNSWGVDDDFTKLIVARADIRVFVCWVPNTKNCAEKREELVRGLKKLVAESKSAADEDEYLIACGDFDTERFAPYSFTAAEARKEMGATEQ